MLMHRHQELCAHAVDALEIAAGLEAHGVTDRTAARFRHRDVFSLAEELYARVPRADPAAAPGAGPPHTTAPARRSRIVCGALHLLPGAVCVAAAAALASVTTAPPAVRTAVGASGLVLLALAVRLGVRSGPLRLRHGTGPHTAGLWVCWTAGYAVYGDWLLGQLLAGGPDLPPPRPGPPSSPPWHSPSPSSRRPAAPTGSPCVDGGSWPPAADSENSPPGYARCCSPSPCSSWARWWRCSSARQRSSAAVTRSRWGRRPRWGAALPRPAARRPRLPEAAATGLASAAALEALAPALVLIARLPGVPPVDAPVAALATTVGPAAVPAVACTAAALGLLVHGLRALTGACAHWPAPSGPAEAHRP
ncbi:hypothetical protein [Streptomyces sp. RPA4-5]|uniref:hypothetical protein n=1 Tax=Streptomyces sp. RPA4-5 TaxID=2721245 RepID=UPI001B3C58BA|nr:hypothetical protein [Streptomyces sp. RPA4-5]